MNYRPEISTDGGKSFGQNAQVFATKEEAETMARDIFGRWMLATDYRAAETEDPVTHTIEQTPEGPTLRPVPAPASGNKPYLAIADDIEARGADSEGGEHD